MTVSSGLPWGRPLTYADLDEMPEDGHRYELVDGVLLVSPAPSWQHQDAASSLVVLLRTVGPPDLKAFVAPLDVVLADDTVVEPDVLVVRRSDLDERRNIHVPPLLVVEVLSPSTRAIDLTLKRERYARAGVASYWIVDPLEPSIRCLELRDGGYEETAAARGDETVRLEAPFAVEITPSALVEA